MNLKTTLVLLLLVGAGGVLLWYGPGAVLEYAGVAPAPRKVADAGQAAALDKELAEENLTRLVVGEGAGQQVFERAPDGTWTMPGGWPTRPREVKQLVEVVTSLRTRFAPIPAGGDLARYGLDKPAVTVTAHTKQNTQTVLHFGQEPESASNRFSRATYLRVGDKPEVLRLAPGLVASLSRSVDYYRSRWLFPYKSHEERLLPATAGVKDREALAKAEPLAVQGVTVGAKEDKEKKEPARSLTLAWADGAWALRYPVAGRPDPVRDVPDPDKARSLLNAVPELWVEKFVEKPGPLTDYGLADPERRVEVARASGKPTVLLIGKVSRKEKREVARPAPPGPFGQQMPPMKDTVEDEYRFAKLQDNNQVFEVKADKFADLFAAADALRDARLARFRTEDVRKVEITQGGTALVLAKEKDKERWQFVQPLTGDVEAAKVTELLDKLNALQATGADVLDAKADPKTHGLDQPAAVLKVTAEETKGEGDAKTTKARTYTLTLGKHDAEKQRLAIQVAGRDRVNLVEDSLLKLVQRPALAYRGRRVLDFNAGDVAKVEIQRGPGNYAVEQDKGAWKLTAPTQADLDGNKTGQLVGDLGRLEVVEFVEDNPQPASLGAQYGLDQPAVRATVSFTAKDKPAQALLVGKARAGKPEYFAKLASAPGVFVVRKETFDALNQDSLALLNPQLWAAQPEEVTTVRITRPNNPEYALRREGAQWKISGPFDAVALPELTAPLADVLANVRADSYVAHREADPKKYGLDAPLRVAVTTVRKDAAGKEEKKDNTLLLGKAAEGSPGRYAKLTTGEAIFVVGGGLWTAVDHAAVDLLDRDLLKVDAQKVARIQSAGSLATLTLERQGDGWQVKDTPASPFAADPALAASFADAWSGLKAQRYAAYGDKVDLKTYGLDAPAQTVRVTLQPDKPGDKPAEHTLALGKAVEGSPGERYARVNNGPGVVVLSALTVAELTRGHLDLVNRNVQKFDVASVTALARKMGGEDLEVAKKEEAWSVVKPQAQKADQVLLDGILDNLANLRARKVAAYPAKDLKPFGLDEPAAVVTVRRKDAAGKPAEHVLKVGKVVEGEAGANGERYATAGSGDTVVVLAGSLAKRLTAPPLQFRDRGLARFADADRVTLERGARKATFAKVSGNWKMTEPLDADAEQADLEDFLNGVARLRADELVAEKPGDLKPYGLDKPEARWRFLAGDQEVLNLVVGAREKAGDKEGPRCYAKLDKGDLVFLLDARLTDKALGEFRSRSVWPPLDAAQIDGLKYGPGSGAFTLEKVDNVWQVIGKPGTTVNAEVIRDTLDALAGLKAQRYADDKGTEAKLFGLEPPDLVVEIQTRTGKRSLQIGRREGGSERYYARVGDTDKAPVFVVAAADAARIRRALNDFTQPAKRPATP